MSGCLSESLNYDSILCIQFGSKTHMPQTTNLNTTFGNAYKMFQSQYRF